MPAPAIAILLLQVVLSSLDLQLLEKYSNPWTEADAGSQLEEQARADFGGRGVEVANHFLIHTGPKPRNDAFYFVLGAVGDSDTALALIRALPSPPSQQSGMLARHFGEISTAIEAVLTNEATRRDPRIVAALEQAVSTARARPSGMGRHEAVTAVRLIAMCRSTEAARALARFTADPDPEIRTAAAGALRQLEPATAPDAASAAADLLRVLVSDSTPQARRQAADSLGSVEGAAIDTGLRAALHDERDPRVVDGIVQALRRRGTPVEDPGQCRDLVGRTWEAAVAQQLLDCWRRQGASHEELVQAALDGSATQRAVALLSLTAPDPLDSAKSLVVDTSTSTALLEPPLRDRLLEAAVWVLSEERISDSTRDTAELALWNLSGRRMHLATAYADRVTPNAARYRASAALARADGAAYDARRRPQQAVIGLAIMLAFGLLSGLLSVRRSPLRRPALLLTMSAAGWVLWTFQASGVRDLPPPPLQLLSVAALALFSAGSVTAAAAMIRRPARTASSTIIRGVLTLTAAAGIAGVMCFATRRVRLFPSDRDGWELVFDPIGAAVLAAVAAAILMAIGRVLPMVKPDLRSDGSR